MFGWRTCQGLWQSHQDLQPCLPSNTILSLAYQEHTVIHLPQIRVSNASFTGSGDQGVLLCPTSPATFLTGPKSLASVFCGVPVLGRYVAVRLLDPKSDITSSYGSVLLCGVDVWALVRAPKGAQLTTRQEGTVRGRETDASAFQGGSTSMLCEGVCRACLASCLSLLLA